MSADSTRYAQEMEEIDFSSPGVQVPSEVPNSSRSILHTFWLRIGWEVEISLPADLTIREAERLSDAIRTFPF